MRGEEREVVKRALGLRIEDADTVAGLPAVLFRPFSCQQLAYPACPRVSVQW